MSSYTAAIAAEEARLAQRCFSVGAEREEALSQDASAVQPAAEVVAAVVASATPESVPQSEQAFAMLQGWVKHTSEEDIYRAVIARALQRSVDAEYEAAIIAFMR